MIRSVERLHQDQAAVLASYRDETAGRDSVAALPRPGGVTAVTVYARVSQVVASDATYGPHLLVVRQGWTGTPPAPSDAATDETRCYPTPNHVVADYEVDEIVRLVVAHSCLLAERLA
jgi:hypothetical protein